MESISNISEKQGETYYQKDSYYVRNAQEDTWQGKLKEELELKNPNNVTSEDFNKLLKEHPERAGFDVCFSAPKSVSIAALLGNEETQADMKAAHEAAVQAVLNQIEKEAIGARVTRDGVTEHIKTDNMIAAKFNHYVSRNSDPQLHTHAVILNKTRYNGKDYAIDNVDLYKNKIIHGQLYRNELAKQLMKKGYELQCDQERGFFELKDIDTSAIEKFSTRRAEIVEKLKEWDATGAEASEKATLTTRKAKQHKDLNLLKESWKETLAENGVEINVPKSAESIIITKEQQQEEFRQAMRRLEKRQFAFTDKEIQRATLAAGISSGMNHNEFKDLLKSETPGLLIDLGKPISEVLKESKQNYYTTKKNLDNEQYIFAEIVSTRNTMPSMEPTQVDQRLQKALNRDEAELSSQQHEAVQLIATTTDKYMAIQGLAGTGKTHMLRYAGELLKNEGYDVKGAAYTGKAAQGLEQDGDIQSGTIHSLLNQFEKEAGNRIPGEDLQNKEQWNFNGLKPGEKPEAWIVDEASLVDNNTLRHLMQAAKLKNAKVVLVGDQKQLEPVGVGNAFQTLVERQEIKTVIMDDIRRQKNKELLEAVKEIAMGDLDKSLKLLEKDTVTIKKTNVRLKTIADDLTALSPEEQRKTIVLTASNKDRIKLNEEIRKNLLAKEQLTSGAGFTIHDPSVKKDRTIELTVEDRIIFLQNDNKLGIRNGEVGYITKIDGKTLTIRGESSKETIVNTEKYNKIDYGYTMTSHKAQGITVNRVLININSNQEQLNNRNAFYVNISRARHKARIYTDDMDKVNKQIEKFTKKINSSDFVGTLVTAIKSEVEVQTLKQITPAYITPINNNISSIYSVLPQAQLGQSMKIPKNKPLLTTVSNPLRELTGGDITITKLKPIMTTVPVATMKLSGSKFKI